MAWACSLAFKLIIIADKNMNDQPISDDIDDSLVQQESPRDPLHLFPSAPASQMDEQSQGEHPAGEADERLLDITHKLNEHHQQKMCKQEMPLQMDAARLVASAKKENSTVVLSTSNKKGLVDSEASSLLGTGRKHSMEEASTPIHIAKEVITKEESFNERAIPLILWNNQAEKFEICQEAKRIIQGISGPIGVIAVAGMYRTGKSYLLNRVLLNLHCQKAEELRSLEGFNVGPTINPCTKGLWMWTQPIVGFTESGEKMNVIVIDSEGLGGLDEDNDHDVRIFALALLLSSYFLYNSMGSIDENALQNLSFVSNLSAIIRGKAGNEVSSDQADQDEEDLIQYMPKFMWVVRDFTLQLVDQEENPISPKDYLENALKDCEVSGDFKSSQEVKGQLRKFFKQRDCCTMVRPIVDENNLQNLNQLPVDQLRPEFVQQTFSLRNKILQSMVFKRVNNSSIDGKMWMGMVHQFVQALNDGCVPSVESSWAYICRQKAEGVLDEAKRRFEAAAKEELQFPVNEHDIEGMISFQKEKATTEFQQAMEDTDNDITSAFLEELLSYIDTQAEAWKGQNLLESRQLAHSTLTQLFTELNSRFVSDTSVAALSVNVKSLELTLGEIERLYDGNVNQFSEKFQIFLSAKAAFFTDLIFFVHQTLATENESLNKLIADIQDQRSASNLEERENIRIERQAMESKLKETVLAKTDAEASLQLLREQYQALKEQKDSEDEENHQQSRDLKEKLQKRIDEQQRQKEEFEEQIQELTRNHKKATSEFEKERALFEQKIEFLEKNLHEKQAKERENLSSWNNQKTELSSELRQATHNYENQLKVLSLELDEEKERAIELEGQLADLKTKAEEQEATWTENEAKYKQLLEESQEHASNMEAATNALKTGSIASLQAQLKEKCDQASEMQKKLKELDEKAYENEEDLKSKIQASDKELAIKDQSIEFLEIQLAEVKQKLEDANKQHQLLCQQIEDQKATEESDEEQEGGFNSESPSKSERLQKKLENALADLTASQDRVQELELQINLKASEHAQAIKELERQLADLEQVKSSQFSQSREYDQQRQELEDKFEEKLRQQQEVLEQEMEEKQTGYEADLQAIQQRSEESLAALKQFYETEKEKQESRIREERERAQQKINQYQEEFELRMKDEFTEKDEEIDLLRDDLADLEARYNQTLTQSQHELNLKQQIIDTLEKQVEDLKKRIDQMETTRSQTFEKQLEFFEQQRHEFNSKIDKLQADNLDKDRQIHQLTHKVERTQEDCDRKVRDQSFAHEQLISEREQLTEKLEQAKKRLGELQDEAQQNQLVFSKEQALSQQSIEFLQAKIEEMQAQFEDKTQFYEGKLANCRHEAADELASQLERVKSEKELWEQKCEGKKQTIKDLESRLHTETQDLRANLVARNESYTRLEQEKRKIEQELSEQIANLQSQVHNLDSSAGEALYFGNAQAETIVQFKQQIQDLDRQLMEAQSEHEKDKALWQGKFQFLEKQKDQYKRDLAESQRRFEQTLEQLQKRGFSAQDKFESSQATMTKALETKYKAQVKEMHESHQALQTELHAKIKRLDEENKKLHQTLNLTQREADSERMSLQTKLNELVQNEQIMQNELTMTRQEKEKKVADLQSQLLKDKEQLKSKLAEAERRVKEAEARRSKMLFDFEKEKAHWQMENDTLVNQKRELDQIIANLERRKDILFKENERLKSGWKQSYNRSSVERRSSVGSGHNNSLRGDLNTSNSFPQGVPTNLAPQEENMRGSLGADEPLGSKLGSTMQEFQKASTGLCSSTSFTAGSFSNKRQLLPPSGSSSHLSKASLGSQQFQQFSMASKKSSGAPQNTRYGKAVNKQSNQSSLNEYSQQMWVAWRSSEESSVF